MKDTPRRATVYFEPDIHQALRLKAAEGEASISEIVNSAVRLSLAEDAIDLAAFEKTKKEKSVSFESVVKRLRARGKI